MQPVLIGGMGRSGTTILKNTLATHSQIMGLGGEMRWLADPRGLFHFISIVENCFSPPIVDRAWKEFKSLLTEPETRSKYLGVFGEVFGLDMIDKLERTLFDSHDPGSKYHGWTTGPFYEMPYFQIRSVTPALRFWLDELMEHRAEEFGIQPELWIDDTPENVWFLGKAITYLDAVTIHCVRHPYDIVASVYQRQQAANVPWWWPVEPEDIAKRIHNIWRYTRIVDPYMVRIEDLVRKPAETILQACQMCGISVEDEMDRYILPNMAHIDRWKMELDKHTLITIQPILQPVIREWGYAES